MAAGLVSSGISVDDFNVYLSDADRPLRNHAISDIYPPGSTYKLVTAIAAMEEGVTTPSQVWPTYGCYQIPGAPRGECLYDWNRQGFGPLAMVDAFAVSSDTFFYQMAVHTGVDPLAEWANDLQDLLVIAVNQAVEQSQTMAAQKMEQITGGLGDIPGLGGLLGG